MSDTVDFDSVFYDPDRYERWKIRKKSLLVKSLLKVSSNDPDELPKYLHTSKSYFNTKLARNSFSFEDLVIAAYFAGLHFALLDDDGVLQHSITFEDWFTDYDEVVIKRAKLIEKIKNDALAEERRKEFEAKHKEYKQIKLNLQQMKEEYGFED